MNNKFNLTREQNVFVAKRNIVDYIWKSANLEGIGVTYPETQAIYDGGIVNGLTVDKIIAINNLKYAWEFILENDGIEYDFKALSHLHKLTCDKLVLDGDLGRLRSTPVNIGGTTWKTGFPIESQIKEELEKLLNQPEKTKTEIAIEVMLWIMRRQMFIEAPLKSIQEKNPWCIDVQPEIRSHYIMKANAKNYPSIYIAYDDDFYDNGIDLSNPLTRYLVNKRWLERRKIVENSKSELLEIKKILESFGFKSENEGLITASSRFLVIPHSFEEIEIQKRPIESLYIHRIKLNKNAEFYSDYCGLARFNDKDGKKYADSFVKKLYLTKK